MVRLPSEPFQSNSLLLRPFHHCLNIFTTNPTAQALSDAHNFLFDERQRLLALQAENDELRLQEIQDRKNMHQLLQGGPGAPGRPGQPAQMPGPNVDHLLLQIESLHAQLNEQVRPACLCAHHPKPFCPACSF